MGGGEPIDAFDPDPSNQLRFRFVLISCVRASGRGQTVWACESRVASARGVRLTRSRVQAAMLFCCRYVHVFGRVLRTATRYTHFSFDSLVSSIEVAVWQQLVATYILCFMFCYAACLVR